MLLGLKQLALQYMIGLVVKDPDEVRTIFLVVFTACEPLRLYAGYTGNLAEKVLLPDFSSFQSGIARLGDSAGGTPGCHCPLCPNPPTLQVMCHTRVRAISPAHTFI